MLVHIVLWNFKSDLSEIEQQEGAKKIKDGLEHLTKSIPEIIKIEVGFNALNAPMENHQISLYTEFDSMDSLLIYQKHPDHLAIGKIIKQYTQERICIDYYVERKD
jgi:hypothetical protein